LKKIVSSIISKRSYILKAHSAATNEDKKLSPYYSKKKLSLYISKTITKDIPGIINQNLKQLIPWTSISNEKLLRLVKKRN
jgi:hypothetical protein